MFVLLCCVRLEVVSLRFDVLRLSRGCTPVGWYVSTALDVLCTTNKYYIMIVSAWYPAECLLPSSERRIWRYVKSKCFRYQAAQRVNEYDRRIARSVYHRFAVRRGIKPRGFSSCLQWCVCRYKNSRTIFVKRSLL